MSREKWTASQLSIQNLGCNGQRHVCKVLRTPVDSAIPDLINADAAFLQPAEGAIFAWLCPDKSQPGLKQLHVGREPYISLTLQICIPIPSPRKAF